MKTPFEILDIPESVTDPQVKTAYLQKTREFPPERFPEKFKEIKDAYEKIKSFQDRVSYKLFHLDEPNMENFMKAMRLQTDGRIQAERLLALIAETAREEIMRKT
jgi:curved DNA-binding protein CbpA